MDHHHGVSGFRHRKTPSSDRFLGVLSAGKGGSVEDDDDNDNAAGDDELNEYDVFWTGDFARPAQRRPSNKLRRAVTQPERFGILAALSEDLRGGGDSDYPLLYRTASLSPPSSSSNSFLHKALKSPMAQISRPIPALPKPQQLPPPARKFQQSAPVNVPVFSRKPSRFGPEIDDDDDDGDDEMLPPHEIVARSNTARSTFSVLEGVGRTLKGRDLRQVRNAVWRQTGFLD